MFDMLGLGCVAVDDLIYVEAFPPPDAKTAVLRTQRQGISLAHLRQRVEAGPVHSFIVVDETRQTRNIFFDASKAVGADEQWPEAKVIESARVLFVDTFGMEG